MGSGKLINIGTKERPEMVREEVVKQPDSDISNSFWTGFVSGSTVLSDAALANLRRVLDEQGDGEAKGKQK